MSASQHELSAGELRHLVGDVDDATIADILALDPSMEDVEEAICWLEGEGSVPGNSQWPLHGKTARIYDILVLAYEDEPPEAPSRH